MKPIIEALEAIANEFGAEALEQVINDIYNNSSANKQDGSNEQNPCSSGYVYSATLGRCVPDIG